MIISLGVDCGVTFYLKEKNVRTIALPFDWVVTYNGVTDLIKNNFKKFKENVLMPHHSFPKDIEKYIRRMKRFKSASVKWKRRTCIYTQRTLRISSFRM